MRQIIYQSRSTGGSAEDAASDILRGAQSFNGLNGITGLLCAFGGKYLQVLEGPCGSVDATMERIRADPRHYGIEILTDANIDERAFGDWTMAFRDRGHPIDLLDERLRLLVREVPAPIADRFRAFIGG